MVLRLSEVSHADGLVVVDCQSRPGCQDTVTIGVGDVFLRSSLYIHTSAWRGMGLDITLCFFCTFYLGLHTAGMDRALELGSAKRCR